VIIFIKRLRVLVTQECNLKCKWCCKEGQFTDRKQISADEFLDGIYFLNRFGLEEVKFSGGEPLLYDNLHYLIKETNKLGIKTSTTTNGILLYDKIRDLQDAKLNELSVTLNTLNPELFKELCNGTKEQLESIVRGIKSIKENKDITKNRNINLVVNYKNIGGIPRIIELSKEYKFDVRFIRLINERTEGYVAPKCLFDYLKTEFKEELQIPDYDNSYNQFRIGDVKCCYVNSACGENPSCERCNSSFFMRLTTDGKLKPCLASEKGEVDLINSLREARKTVENVVNSKAKWGLR